MFIQNLKAEVQPLIENGILQNNNSTMYPFDLIPGPLYIFVIIGGVIGCILVIGAIIGLQIFYDKMTKKIKKKKPRHDGIGMNLGLELDSDFSGHHNEVTSPVLFEPDDFNQQNKNVQQQSSQFSQF